MPLILPYVAGSIQRHVSQSVAFMTVESEMNLGSINPQAVRTSTPNAEYEMRTDACRIDVQCIVSVNTLVLGPWFSFRGKRHDDVCAAAPSWRGVRQAWPLGGETARAELHNFL